MSTIILEARDLTFTYPQGDEVLRGLSFHIWRGEKIAIVGPNGTGKSTLLMMFNGILRPRSGVMLYDNQPIEYDRSSLRQLRKQVGFVLQNPDQQVVAPTVYQDVGFGPANLGMSEDEVDEAVARALQAVGLEGFERRAIHQLSGGEKKKVAIAGVLAMEPEVLVFDEPTSSLDPAASAEIMELLDELNEQGTTIVISTHDIELIYPWADRAILMVKGRILQEDTPERAFGDREAVRTARLSAPLLLDLYQELANRGVSVPERRPRSVLEMLQVLDHAFAQGPPRVEVGRIRILDVREVDDAWLRAWHAAHLDVRVGAMGTRAKHRAAEAEIPLHYTHGVVDKCILRALIGEETLVLTSGGMVDRVFERVEEYASQSGVDIPVSRIEGS